MASARDREPDSGLPAAFAGSAVPRQFARTENSARLGRQAKEPNSAEASFDRRLVRELLGHLTADPDVAMEYFYARLFTDNPGLRGLFPYAMTQTRAAVFRMLTALVKNLDDEHATAQALGQIARDHRAWRSALGYFAAVMSDAVDADARAQPAWWTGEIVQHDRRTETVAVLTIRPDRPLTYEPGQYLAVQAPRWPRIWRNYSIANAPRENGLIDIHVRAVPGGMVSTALASHCVTGDTVLLGAARGGMRVPADPVAGLVCVAGGTGLAPLKAITEAVVGAARQGRRRAITLYVGGRRSRDLYDLRDLETLRLAYPSLTVIPVVERELGFDGRVGRLPDVVGTHASFRDCDVYIAGPVAMISATVRALARRIPADRLHHDSLDALRVAHSPPRPGAQADHAGDPPGSRGPSGPSGP